MIDRLIEFLLLIVVAVVVVVRKARRIIGKRRRKTSCVSINLSYLATKDLVKTQTRQDRSHYPKPHLAHKNSNAIMALLYMLCFACVLLLFEIYSASPG
jgi:hypothetical protein